MTKGFRQSRLGAAPDRLFDPVMAVELDPYAAETYAVNLGDHVDVRDIREIPDEDFESADVVIGGPPCQGFSSLNRNREGDHRRRLWQEYARALRATGAQYFVMENVRQLLTSPEFETFKAEATKAGWTITEDVLLAADYGVPQARRRAIVIGSLHGAVALPAPTHAEPGSLFVDLPHWLTVRDAIGGLAPEPDGAHWHRARNPTAVSRLRYRHVPMNGNRFDMQRSLDAEGLEDLVPSCWRRKTTGTTDVFGRMDWNRPAPTIRTEFYKPEKGRYLHPEQDRPITVREGALLMGFPDDFDFPEHMAMSQVGRQIGNAVPPPLARCIAEAVAADAVYRGVLQHPEPLGAFAG